MKSLKFHLLIIVLALFIKQIYGQITIDGTVTDSELNPISDALVEIIDETDTNNVYSDVTDASGYFSISNITDIEGQSKLVPADRIILRNYPNPFNPTTVIYFELPKSENIEIKIYDILGREIRAIYNNYKKAGVYNMIWDGRNNSGGGVAAGIYFCRLKTKDQFKVHKMVLMDGGSNTSPLSSAKLTKPSVFEDISKTKSNLNFKIRTSGEQIITTEFSNLKCSSDTTIALIVPRVIQSIIIGKEGGLVELENFSLRVPEGAFSADTEIKIFERLPDEWDKDFASKIIGVEGIPKYFNHPLDIKIKSAKELSEESYITIGQEYEISFTNTTELVYKFMDTYDTAGVLSSQILADSNNNLNHVTKITSSSNKQHKIYFSAKTGYYSVESTRKHFKIFTNYNDRWNIITKVNRKLEEIFDIVKITGFDTLNINWPVEVYVKKFEKYFNLGRACLYYPTYGKRNMCLLIDLEVIVSDGKDFIREYAIGICRSYDDEFFLPNEFTGKVNPDRYWFHLFPVSAYRTV